MRYIIYVILIGAIVGVTFGLFASWGWNGMVPDLVLLMVIALSLVFETSDYLFVALIGGFWLDIVYGLPIGSFTIPLALCGALSSMLLRKWLFSEIQWYHFAGAIVGATILLKLWIWIYANVLFIFHWYHMSVSGAQIARNLIWAIIANVILAYPVYVIVEMFARSQLRWQKNRIKL
jgi:cell shape-determining protein MreD